MLAERKEYLFFSRGITVQPCGSPLNTRARLMTLAAAPYCEQASASNCGSAERETMLSVAGHVEFVKMEFARNGIATFFPFTERSPGKLIEAHGRWISFVLESFSICTM